MATHDPKAEALAEAVRRLLAARADGMLTTEEWDAVEAALDGLSTASQQ